MKQKSVNISDQNLIDFVTAFLSSYTLFTDLVLKQRGRKRERDGCTACTWYDQSPVVALLNYTWHICSASPFACLLSCLSLSSSAGKVGIKHKIICYNHDIWLLVEAWKISMKRLGFFSSWNCLTVWTLPVEMTRAVQYVWYQQL